MLLPEPKVPTVSCFLNEGASCNNCLLFLERMHKDTTDYWTPKNVMDVTGT